MLRNGKLKCINISNSGWLTRVLDIYIEHARNTTDQRFWPKRFFTQVFTFVTTC
jgi:hypothetical protein